MPRQLGAADSFNSSGATIIPDKPERNGRRTAGNSSQVSTLSSARILMPQDTLGRELDEVMRGLDNSDTDINQEQLLRQYGFDSGDISFPSSQPTDPSSMSAEEEFAAILNGATSNTSDLMSGLQLDSSNQAFHPPPPHQPSSTSPFNHNQSPFQIPSPIFEVSPNTEQGAGNFRPESAHSHRSSISGSEWSYATTEVSEDNDIRMDGPGPGQGGVGGMVPGAGHGNAIWTGANIGIDPNNITGNHHNLGGQVGQAGQTGQAQYPTPTASVGGPSPPTVPGDMFGGPMRGITGGTGGDEETKRKERLEHRRSINRKSAQKHRARRKEEMEQFQRMVADRDAKIHQLERDLAVEKAKTQQLAGFIKMQLDRKKEEDNAGYSGNAVKREESTEDGSQQPAQGLRRSARGQP